MQCAICGADAWYVCGRSGRPVCVRHSRIEIVSRLSFGSSDGLAVREASDGDCGRIREIANYFWGEERVACLGKEYDIGTLPAYVVHAGGKIAGLLSYALDAESLIIVMLNVLPGYQGLGAGKMLLDAVKEKAAVESRTTVLVTTSNDDLPAMYFYQKNGFQIYEIMPDLLVEHHGGVEVGFAGIQIRDEVRLRFSMTAE